MLRRMVSLLYVQVLVAIVIGVALGDAFIKLIKVVIAPVVFCTVVHGIASARDAGSVGRPAVAE